MCAKWNKYTICYRRWLSSSVVLCWRSPFEIQTKFECLASLHPQEALLISSHRFAFSRLAKKKDVVILSRPFTCVQPISVKISSDTKCQLSLKMPSSLVFTANKVDFIEREKIHRNQRTEYFRFFASIPRAKEILCYTLTLTWSTHSKWACWFCVFKQVKQNDWNHLKSQYHKDILNNFKQTIFQWF